MSSVQSAGIFYTPDSHQLCYQNANMLSVIVVIYMSFVCVMLKVYGIYGFLVSLSNIC